jgi:hypothetical protein
VSKGNIQGECNVLFFLEEALLELLKDGGQLRVRFSDVRLREMGNMWSQD